MPKSRILGLNFIIIDEHLQDEKKKTPKNKVGLGNFFKRTTDVETPEACIGGDVLFPGNISILAVNGIPRLVKYCVEIVDQKCKFVIDNRHVRRYLSTFG